MNPCTTDACNAGTLTHDPLSVGTRCNTTNYCDSLSRCVACLAGTDCGTATECADTDLQQRRVWDEPHA